MRDVIGKRLSRLSDECNRILAVAAVVGRDFALDVLTLTLAMDEDRLVAALEEAMRVGVLEEEARPGVIRYRFTHAFFRQTLYEELSAPRRLRLHQQVARALETQYGARLAEHAAELAEHYAQSTDPADLRKAVSYSEMAAQRAMAVYAYSEAVRLLEQAIEVQQVLDPDDLARRCDLLLALGWASQPAGGDGSRARAAADEAFVMAEKLGDSPRAAAVAHMALAARYIAAWARTSPDSREWLARLGRHAAPGTAIRCWFHHYQGGLWVAEERYEESAAEVREAMALARELHEPNVLWYSLGASLSGAQITVDGEAERERLIAEFASMPRDVGSPRWQTGVLFGGGLYHLAHGDRPRAERVWQELREMAARTREPNPRRAANWARAYVASLDGRLTEALSSWNLVRERVREQNRPVILQEPALSGALRPLLWLGRAGEAVPCLEAAIATEREGHGPRLQRSRLALCLAYLNRSAEARTLLQPCMAGFPGPPERIPACLLCLFLETAVLLGDREAALHLAAPLTPLGGQLTPTSYVALTSIDRLLGGAAALQGDAERAQHHYEQALALCARIGFRPETAVIQLELAELLLRGSPHREQEALQHLDFAIGEFRDMNMQPSLERALKHKGLLHA